VLSVARSLFGGALIISLSTGMALGARKYVKTSPRFSVTEVAVTGLHRRSPEEIANVGQITKGANIFSIDLGRTRALVLSDPWIKDATVSRRLPSTIYLTVTEKEPAVLVAAGDTYLYTRDGLPIKKLEAKDPADYPIITGIAAQTLTDDREGAQKMVKTALDLVDAYDRTGLGMRAPIEELHYEKDGAMSVIVGKSGTTVSLGAPPWKRKLDQAVRVFAELDRRGQKPDTVFLDNEAHPERVVVRMR
jgi:cell division protein FtsQ